MSHNIDYYSMHEICDMRFAMGHFETPEPSGMDVVIMKQVSQGAGPLGGGNFYWE